MARLPLTPDEVEDYWALGCPINTAYVADEKLAMAIAQHRVEIAISWSSMGTGYTYWARVRSLDELVRDRTLAVAWPAGHEVPESTEQLDERDSYRWLWKPFYEQQQAIAARAVVGDPSVLAEYAAVLAELERAWMRGSMEREPALAVLLQGGNVDEFVAGAGRAQVHLVRGVRARWVRRDVAMMLDACISSIERFGQTRRFPITREELRHELVQLAVRVARGRSWRGVHLPPW